MRETTFELLFKDLNIEQYLDEFLTITGATSVEDLCFLTNEDWNQINLPHHPKRILIQFIEGMNDLPAVVGKIQESANLGYRFRPFCKKKKTNFSLTYANLADNIPIVGREDDIKAISDMFKLNFNLLFDIEERFDQKTKIKQIGHPVVTGAPGIGKTTMGMKCKEIITDCLGEFIEEDPLYLRVSFSMVEAELSSKDK